MAMPLAGISEVETAFVAQHEQFLQAAMSRYRSAAVSLSGYADKSPQPLDPIIVEDLRTLTSDELRAVAEAITAGSGVAHLVPRRFALPEPGERHPLVDLANCLMEESVIGYAVDHPMEGHPEAVGRFGVPDGTLKLYDLPIPSTQDKYREQAETNEMFASHNDGLGYAGLIRHAILTLDRPPLVGGYTYFSNLVALAPALHASDPEAFEALFLPDAITALRPRGKGAIRVTSPVFFIGRDGDPQVFFRIASGEYVIEWRDHPALARARAVLERACAPFAPGTQFAHLMRPGDTIIIHNAHVVHGRTAFVDPREGGRVLARKWYVSSPQDAVYRHVPGIAVHERWGRLFPDQFCGKAIEGEWHYDATLGRNLKAA